MNITDLKEKYPEQMKWLVRELYKAYTHEGDKNVYNYFQSNSDEYGPERIYKILGPDVSLCYYYIDSRSKKLVCEIKGNKVFTFEQYGFGDGDILKDIEEWLDKYHEKGSRFSTEQVEEWAKYTDAYYSFFTGIYKKMNIQPSPKMEKVFRIFKQALMMSMSEAEKFFPKESHDGKYPLFDYGFKFTENMDSVNLCYNWMTRPMVKYGSGYREMDYYELNEAGLKKFKGFFERQLERKVNNYKSDRTLELERITAEIRAKAKERAGLKEEIIRLSGRNK